ncbi:hypothetical protein BLNAU_23697 [Blattamonas nauphoetae]|uniref:Secreted protein n=1 Tax=Blattamonas nauphoetae TaxID=2049346 RepID=A0ABQ9WPJ6_9EUKA|nr:hypothetical protein BLNAU_23697 [Blattamonas nauphoetae]
MRVRVVLWVQRSLPLKVSAAVYCTPIVGCSEAPLAPCRCGLLQLACAHMRQTSAASVLRLTFACDRQRTCSVRRASLFIRVEAACTTLQPRLIQL